MVKLQQIIPNRGGSVKREKNYGTDIIPEKAHKMMHNVSFTFIALVAGVVLFWISQLAFTVGINKIDADVPDITSETSKTLGSDLGHDYCGTFFIWENVENNFGTLENYYQYEQAASYKTDNTAGKIIMNLDSLNITFIPIIIFICMMIVFRKVDMKRFFQKYHWRWLMAAGIAYLLSSFMKMAKFIYLSSVERDFGCGIFASSSYYCQIYQYFGIPAIIILTALIMRQHTLITHKQSTDGNAKALKGFALLMAAVGICFMLVRLGTRVYEIICYKTHDARLPFYYEMLDFPRELAESPETYRNVLIFRLFKDMPVFIASAITLIMLVKILFSSAQNRINTAENMKRFNISMIALAFASLFYNLLGIHEVHMITGHFSGIYEIVTYTIGIRSLTDPLLYMVIMWFVKSFVQIIPPTGETEQIAVV